MSSAGRCIACSTASGIVVGPGMARNSRPARTVMLDCPCCYGWPWMQCRARNFKLASPLFQECLGHAPPDLILELGRRRARQDGDRARLRLAGLDQAQDPDLAVGDI